MTLNGNPFTVNGTALAVGAYTIISQASGSVVSNGTFTVTGTAIGSGNAGTISVTAGNVVLNIVKAVNQLPPNLLLSTSPTSITIGWPTNLGWRLQYQSNSVTTGLLTNSSYWLTWPNSTTATQMVIPIGNTNEMFFRMIYP